MQFPVIFQLVWIIAAPNALAEDMSERDFSSIIC